MAPYEDALRNRGVVEDPRDLIEQGTKGCMDILKQAVMDEFVPAQLAR